MSFELRPKRKETIGVSMNGAPPAYNECIQFPLYEVGSPPGYDDFSGSLPSYEDCEPP